MAVDRGKSRLISITPDYPMPLLPYPLARHVLFGMDPEKAHELTLHSIARAQNTPLQWAWCHDTVDDPIELFFLPMNDRASQQLSHFIIRCPGIAVARCFINDDFPALTAGIRTKSAGTDKRIHIVRFTQFQ